VEQAATRAIIQSHLDTEDELRRAVQGLRDEVAARGAHQVRLQQQSAAITGSRAWRIAGALTAASRRLAPPGSRRNRMLEKVFDRLFRGSPGATTAQAQEDR
jgi:hypothetical protein